MQNITNFSDFEFFFDEHFIIKFFELIFLSKFAFKDAHFTLNIESTIFSGIYLDPFIGERTKSITIICKKN